MKKFSLDCTFIVASSSKKSYQGLSNTYSAIEPPTWALLLAQSIRSVGFKTSIIDANAEISLNLIQNGDNLKFDKFGSNSITKNIKFTQTEASPTIIIRSFN